MEALPSSAKQDDRHPPFPFKLSGIVKPYNSELVNPYINDVAENAAEVDHCEFYGVDLHSVVVTVAASEARHSLLQFQLSSPLL